MSRLFWEDFVAGSIAEYGPRTLSREEIVAFAAAFDPQPMHLDDAAGEASMLGGLAASGWHSCCVLMRMLSDGFITRADFWGAPGVDEVKWLVPMRPGVPLRARATVADTRISRSRPQWAGSNSSLIFSMPRVHADDHDDELHARPPGRA